VKRHALVALDVGADAISALMKRDGKLGSVSEFDNTPEGHRKIVKWVTKGGRQTTVCVEATGVYHLDLALTLNEYKKVEVMVVNPLAMRRYAQAQMRRAKTDRVDPHVILDYLERMPFRAWEPPRRQLFELRALTRRIYQLTRDVDREKNRRHASGRVRSHDAMIGNDIDVNIRHLGRRIKQLQAQAEAVIETDEELTARFERLTSVIGIAEVSATRILAELMFLPEDMKSNQWVAYVGLDPVPDESGKTIKAREISKKGNKYLRSALYMPALVAIQYSANVKAFYERLLSRGKAKLQAIVAVMRKLLVAIWGMFKNRQDFDQEKFYRIAA
jgi:transposase